MEKDFYNYFYHILYYSFLNIIKPNEFFFNVTLEFFFNVNLNFCLDLNQMIYYARIDFLP